MKKVNKTRAASVAIAMLVTLSQGAWADYFMLATDLKDGIHKEAGMTASKLISEQRTQCGLKSVANDNQLKALSASQGLYIKHLNENVAMTDYSSVDTHYQSPVTGGEYASGTTNPFFLGSSFTDRVIKIGFKDAIYGGSENIIQEEVGISNGKVLKPELAAEGFVRGLLAAPYHMHTLLNPERNLIGSSLVSYTPKNPESKGKKGYVMVSLVGSTEQGSDNKVEGIYTYPCQGVTGTLTALYNESPSPVAGTGRNLKTDPIGQPILVYMPEAEKIKVSAVSLVEVKSKKVIPTSILDASTDPHKGTEHELTENKVFILPITDNMDSCPKNKPWKNCGLNANTEYRVTMDVLVDGKKRVRNSFSFSTGRTNY